MSDENNRLDISDEMIAERRQGTGKMPDDMPKWMANTINTIDKSSKWVGNCLLYTSPSPRDGLLSRMPSSA